MAKFKVGDLVVGQNFVTATELNGVEGIVITDLIWQTPKNCTTPNWYYQVTWDDKHTSCVRPHKLKYPDDNFPPEVVEEFTKLMDNLKEKA